MDTKEARTLMQKYASALAYIEVKKPSGGIGIGSCFHVGNGVFVTARHVVEGNIISEVKITEPVAISAKEFYADIPDERVEEYEKTLKEIQGTVPRFEHFQTGLTIKKDHFTTQTQWLMWPYSKSRPSTQQLELFA